MISFNNIKRFLFISLLISIISLLLFDPRIFPDSEGYISYDPARSFGYPLLIFLLNKNLKFVMFLQIFLSTFSCQLFVFKVKNLFNFNYLTAFVLSLILVIIGIKVGLNILTESLSFSLYLLSLFFLIRLIEKGYFRDLLFSSLMIFFAILIRPQLLFAVTHLLLISIYFISKPEKKFFFLILPVLSVLFILPNKLNNLSNSIFNNVDVVLVDTWNQLMILPLFIADPDLKNYFSTELYKKLFVNSYSCAEKKKLTKVKSIYNQQNWVYVLESNSFPVKNCINTNINKMFPNYGQYQKEVISKQFFYETLMAYYNYDLKQLFNGYLKKISFAFFNWFYFLIFLFFSLIFLIKQFFLKCKKLLFLNIMIASHFANIFLIGLGAPMLLRYRFFTEIILIVLLFCIILEYFKNDIKNKP